MIGYTCLIITIICFQTRTDHDAIAPQVRHAQGHAEYVADTYMYSFEHRSVNHDTPDWVGKYIIYTYIIVCIISTKGSK